MIISVPTGNLSIKSEPVRAIVSSEYSEYSENVIELVFGHEPDDELARGPPLAA